MADIDYFFSTPSPLAYLAGSGPGEIAGVSVSRARPETAGVDQALADSGLPVGAPTHAAIPQEAVARGVFGAPFRIPKDNRRFRGQDRLDDLDGCLTGPRR